TLPVRPAVTTERLWPRMRRWAVSDPFLLLLCEPFLLLDLKVLHPDIATELALLGMCHLPGVNGLPDPHVLDQLRLLFHDRDGQILFLERALAGFELSRRARGRARWRV